MAHDIEAVEYLGMDAGLAQNRLWDLAVLTRSAFDQIDHIVYAAVFQSKLLLLVPAVHDRSSQIICSFSLNYKVKDVVCMLGNFFRFLRFLSSSTRFLLGLFAANRVNILLIWINVVDLSDIIFVYVLIMAELISYP
jgi:hypothetical protein